MKRHAGPVAVGGALLIAGVFLFLMLPGCQVGWTDPDAAGNRKAGLLLPLATASDAVNSGVGSVFDLVGGWVGLGGLGGAGAIIAGLTRGWARARSDAAAERAASAAHDDAWNEQDQRYGTFPTVNAAGVGAQAVVRDSAIASGRTISDRTVAQSSVGGAA